MRDEAEANLRSTKETKKRRHSNESPDVEKEEDEQEEKDLAKSASRRRAAHIGIESDSSDRNSSVRLMETMSESAAIENDAARAAAISASVEKAAKAAMTYLRPFTDENGRDVSYASPTERSRLSELVNVKYAIHQFNDVMLLTLDECNELAGCMLNGGKGFLHQCGIWLKSA